MCELGPLLFFVASNVKSHNVTKSRLKWTLDPSWGRPTSSLFCKINVLKTTLAQLLKYNATPKIQQTKGPILYLVFRPKTTS